MHDEQRDHRDLAARARRDRLNTPIHRVTKQNRETTMAHDNLIHQDTHAALEALTAALAEHPEDAYLAYGQVGAIVRDAGATAPAVRIVPGSTAPDGEETEAYFVNPRTGEEDNLVIVDVALEETSTDGDAEVIDAASSEIHIEYDYEADFEGLIYIMESDRRPVSLPAGWSEV